MIEFALEWKNCPLCGGEVILAADKDVFEEYQRDHGFSILTIWCRECHCSLNYIKREIVPYEEALNTLNENWNRRTNE